MSPAELASAAAELVERSCRQAGSPKIDDPDVLVAIAKIIAPAQGVSR